MTHSARQHKLNPVSLNFPYEGPKSFFELLERGVDRYKANYDSVFQAKERFTWAGIPVEIDPDIPLNEIRLRESTGKVHKITNVGQS